jgi:hypothetical protein
MQVRAGRMPGRIHVVNVEEGTTVGEVLSLAGLALEDGFTPRIDGEDVTMDTVMEQDQMVLLCKRVKGNRC